MMIIGMQAVATSPDSISGFVIAIFGGFTLTLGIFIVDMFPRNRDRSFVE
jgi:hypothetical protein